VWYAHDVGWGWWLLMSLGMVAFWGLLIYGVALLARRGSGPSAPEARPPEPPLNVLQRRLAAGEISVDEYERLRDALLDPPHHAKT
jgi:putative membrane protein